MVLVYDRGSRSGSRSASVPWLPTPDLEPTLAIEVAVEVVLEVVSSSKL